MTLCTKCYNFEDVIRPENAKHVPSLDEDGECHRCGADAAEEREKMGYPMQTLTFTAYQEQSRETAIGYADPELTHDFPYETEMKALFLVTAINGEAGELGEKVKKYVREGDESYLDGVESELGDVTWYMAQLCTLLDADFGDVAERNLAKLLDRQERDVITGEGDDR